MSAYPPTTPLPPLPSEYNPIYFLSSTEGLTIALADTFYLRKSGGNCTGLITFSAGLQSSGQVSITNSAQSNSSTTGALVVSGGVGIGKNVHVDGTIHLTQVSSELQMTGTNSNIVMSGSNGFISVANTSASTSSTTGALRVQGGFYAGQNSLLNADLSFAKSGFTNRLTSQALTANRTLTLPNATGTVVLEDNQVSLSNKTLTTLKVGTNGSTFSDMRHGNGSVAIVGASWDNKTATLTFSPAFASTPNVIATITNGVNGTIVNACIITVASISTTGATVVVTNAYTSATTVAPTFSWIAWI